MGSAANASAEETAAFSALEKCWRAGEALFTIDIWTMSTPHNQAQACSSLHASLLQMRIHTKKQPAQKSTEEGLAALER